MEIGTGLFTCQQRPDDDRSLDEIYDEMLELGRVADDAGLDSAWVSEHHFQADSYLSGVTPALGALAAVTDDVELGPCIALAPLYDPVRLAEDVATIDRIADGRTTLGVAIGSNVEEFDAFSVPRAERANHLVDAVKTLRGAWSQGPLAHDSEFHDVSPSVDVTPKPAHDVPIMFGGAAKPAVRRAARLGDAWCAPSALSIDGVRKRKADIERIRDEETVAGDFDVYVLQHGFVGNSREAAWEQMRDSYFYLQRRYEEIFSGETVAELSTDRRAALKEQAIFGTPEQVVDRLDEYRAALGDDIHFILRTYYPGTGTETMADCITKLGDEVRPMVA